MISFTSGNADNTTEAVHGLDIFTKNWCMNCEETEKQGDLILDVANVSFNKQTENVL